MDDIIEVFQGFFTVDNITSTLIFIVGAWLIVIFFHCLEERRKKKNDIG